MNPKPRNALVLLNVLSNYARFGVAILCTLLLTPVVIAQLGADHFGLWTLVLCISGYLELFDFGLTTGAMRSIASLGNERHVQKNRLINTLLVVSLSLAPWVAVAAWGVTIWLHDATATTSSTLAALIVLMTLRVVFILPLGVLMGALFGEHRIWVVNSIRAISITGFTVAAWIAMQTGCSVLFLGFLYSLIYTLEYVAYGLVAVRRIPWLRIDLREFDLGTLKGVLGFSASSFTANASSVMLMRTDPLIVSSFLSLGAVALYAVPMRIAEQSFTLSKQLINVFSPLFAQLHGNGSLAAIRSAYLICAKFSFGMMVGILIPAFFHGKAALRFWIGEEFEASYGVLMILLAAAVLRTIQESSANALVMTGKHYFVARISMASALANLILSLVLVGPLGILGVALATLISVALFGCCAMTLRVCQAYDIPVWRFPGTAIMPSLIPALVQWLTLYGTCQIGMPENLFDLALQGAISFAAYALAFRILSLNAQERRVARRWQAEIFRRFRTLVGQRLARSNARDPIASPR